MKFLAFICLAIALVEGRPRIGRPHAAFIAPRIIGGSEASGRGAWPWQASMEYLGSHSCGAVLISKDLAITAGHCTDGRTALSINVKFGMFDRSANSGEGDYEYITGVDTTDEHPDYSGTLPGFPNDVSKLKLQINITSNEFVSPIALPSSRDVDYDIQDCWITGWGVPDSTGGTVTDRLKQHNTRVIPNTDCQLRMESVAGALVYDNHICVFDNGAGGSCNGDSGGPLSCRTSNSTSDWTVAGVTSWGIRDGIGCLTSYPSVYTRISHHLDFINA